MARLVYIGEQRTRIKKVIGWVKVTRRVPNMDVASLKSGGGEIMNRNLGGDETKNLDPLRRKFKYGHVHTKWLKDSNERIANPLKIDCILKLNVII